MDYVYKIPSPVGELTMSSDGEHLTGLWIEGQKYYEATLEHQRKIENLPVFELTRRWLDIYFTGQEPDFLVPLAPKGSAFRQEVWKALETIPYGSVVTYGSIAKQLNERETKSNTSARAVGGAVSHNPISILIPCHRVIGSNGSLTGYAGGIDKKILLLKQEKVSLVGL